MERRRRSVNMDADTNILQEKQQQILRADEREFHVICMKRAVQLSEDSVAQGTGPFGAVIADEKTRQIIAECHNRVTANHDPTAHAEINAIRLACHRLHRHDLSGFTLFSSCEPCPMCLSASFWARLDKVYYKNTRLDAAEAGFDDEFIYEEVSKAPHDRKKPCIVMDTVDIGIDPKKAFKMWMNMTFKKAY